MSYQPTGFLIGLNRSDIEAIRDAAIASLKNGGAVVTSWSAAGQSVTKSYLSKPLELLAEARMALAALEGRRVRKTFATFS